MATYFTDFSEYSTGSQPSDWTKRFQTTSTITVESIGASNVLRITNASGITRPQGISWDDIDGDADRDDVEVLIKYRWISDPTTVAVGTFGRGSGTNTAANYYGSSDTSTLIRLVERASGSLTTHASSSRTMVNNTWYWARFRANGTDLKSRQWEDGSSEPGTWNFEVTDATLSSAGWVGIVSGAIDNTGQFEVAVFGAGTNGDTAPSSGVASHTTTGALSAAAATVAGSATHLTLHATSGALSAQAATVAGSAVSPHLSTGALTAQAATVAGEAEVIAAGGTHDTTGALSAAAATVAGDAAHLTLHATTGALSAQEATVAGSAAHLTLHTTSGALAAGEATIAGTSVHSGDGATPDVQPAVGGGGWAWAAPRKKRHDYLSPPTREQMAERVRQQREALGILPKPAQKRIEAAVKKEARRAEPSLAPLAPVAVEVAQDTGAPLRAVIEAIQRTFDTQRGLVAARMEADAAQRREEEAAEAERMRVEAEEAQREWQRRLPQLLAADDELLRQGEEARKQAIKTIRQVQQALMALLDR